MMHIGLIDLGFTPEGIDLLTGKTNTVEIDCASFEAFQELSESEQASIVLMQCLTPENEEAAAHPTKDNATAETEPSEKETIEIKSTANPTSKNMTRAQGQQLACLIASLDPSQNPAELLHKLGWMRGTPKLDRLIADLVSVLDSSDGEAGGPGQNTQPNEDPRFNARTKDRLTFYPVDGVASSKREASLPKNTQVRAMQNMLGAVTLFAWVDKTDGPADYVHHHAKLSDFRMED